MKISRHTRDKYFSKVDEDLFSNSERGNVNFDGNVHSVRRFVQLLNKRRNLITYPEMAVKTSDIYSIGLLTEIKDHVYDLYVDQIKSENFNEELYEFLIEKVGNEKLNNATRAIIENYPPNKIYKNQIGIDEFLKTEKNGVKNEINFIDEFISIWLTNLNPAFSSHLELFDDENLEKRTNYLDIVESIREFIDKKPNFKYLDKNIIDILRSPEKKYPHSIKNQLKYINENWNEFLGKWANLILTGLDLIREEEKMRGFGPGKLKGLEFYGLDIENYSTDSDWMPNVIMIAKNAYVWLDQLTKKYKYDIKHLNQIPNEELDKLSKWGFTALWLIGLWKRSPASKTIKKWCGNPEAEASAYSLEDYIISDDLGGYHAYENLRDRALQRGIRLASDMVPNHTGIDSKWVREHPDWYISLPYPPFPSYGYTGADLCGDPNIGIYLEDKYFSRSDAAVSFKRVDFNSGDTKYIYHGNDGTSMPWNDTAQLNFLLPQVREAVIQKIIQVAKKFPIIRFDAAMTLARKHIQRLWFPEPGSGGDIPSRAGNGMTKEELLKKIPEEFWREVVDRVKEEVPDTLLLAEAFWMLEGFFVRTLGMHRVYNSIFMNALRDEDNSLYRDSIKKALDFDPRILKRFVNFMNNPDEETAINQFGTDDKYFGICLLLVTMPGLPMFGHGQIEGYKEKYGMEFRKAYWDEKIDLGLLHHHERTIFPIMKKRYIFSQSHHFYLYDFWVDGHVNEDVYAYSNMAGEERGFVIYNNRYNETKGHLKLSVGYNDNGNIKQKEIATAMKISREGYSIFKDYTTGLEYIRRNTNIQDEGLYFELDGYQGMCFIDWRIKQDNKYFHYAQLYEMLDGKGVHSIETSLKEMIYKPILTPFRELINSNFIKTIFKSTKNFSFFSEKIKENLSEFLTEAQRYASKFGEFDSIVKEILTKTEILYNLSHISNFPEMDDTLKIKLGNILPQTICNWGLYYCWTIIHLIGKISDSENYSMISMSLIDDWRLGNVIQWVLGEIKEKERNIEEIPYLLKILIDFQNWMKIETDSDSTLSYIYLKPILSNPEVQNFLGFNRYKEILWFNIDRFKELSLSLFIIGIIQIIADEKSQNIKKLHNLYTKWLYSAENSQFKVEKLIEELKKE